MANSTTARVANYTPEMTALVVSEYQSGVSVEDIAAQVVKSVRSVRSKLVREGVYVAKPKVVSRKVEGPTKKELLVELSTTGYDVSGLEGATKDAIARLMVALAYKFRTNRPDALYNLSGNILDGYTRLIF